ncbi:MAG: hypothetical protein H7257_10680 [Taibaiella sp.]|nr:hypothetical protein [Taibaiella sp.]
MKRIILNVLLVNWEKMLFFLCFLCVVLCFSPLAAHAQKETYVLEGQAKVQGEDVYKYKIFFSAKRGKIKGYSLTWFPDGMPRKAIVTGNIDEDSHSLIFTEKEESNMLLLKSNDICWFNAMLTYRRLGNKILYTGRFTGINNFGQYCGAGEMALVQELPEASEDERAPTKTKDISKAAQPEEIPAKVETITVDDGKEIITGADTVTLDVWDYGTIDGDEVTVLLNGKSLLTDYLLTGLQRRLHIPLSHGVNTITIIAGNEGEAPPNTARLLLMDGEKQYNMTAYNKKGDRAIITLIKR